MRIYRLFILFLILPVTLLAHEVRPAYFSVSQLTDSTYQVVWKIPAMGEFVPKVYPKLPSSWKVVDEKVNLLPGNLRRTFILKIATKSIVV